MKTAAVTFKMNTATVLPLMLCCCHLVLKWLGDFQDKGMKKNGVKAPEVPTDEWNDCG